MYAISNTAPLKSFPNMGKCGKTAYLHHPCRARYDIRYHQNIPCVSGVDHNLCHSQYMPSTECGAAIDMTRRREDSHTSTMMAGGCWLWTREQCVKGVHPISRARGCERNVHWGARKVGCIQPSKM